MDPVDLLFLGTGTNLVQCNHGGMEPGFDPRPLLDAPEGIHFRMLGPLHQQQFLKEHELVHAGTLQAWREEAVRQVDEAFAAAQKEPVPKGEEEDWCALSQRDLRDRPQGDE